MKSTLAAAVFAAALAPALESSAQEAHADILGYWNEVTGEVWIERTTYFADTAIGLLITIEVRDLPPGWHGVHIHDTGSCSAPDFPDAGDHVNGLGLQHGLDNPEGPHTGDLLNLFVHQDGTGKAEFFTPLMNLYPDDVWRDHTGALLDEDGSSIVIHENRDDHRTTPSGNSGSRIACGIFTGW